MMSDTKPSPEATTYSQRTFSYIIRGGKPVVGEIHCLGAKNFVTKAMVVATLTDDTSTLTNVPPIGDVDITAEMLNSVGVSTSFNQSSLEMAICPSKISTGVVLMPHSNSNRIPILLLGTLLHRFHETRVPVLGGCKIGARSVDFHLNAIRAFGGGVEEIADGFIARRTGPLHGAHVSLPYPSVGATETCLLLAVLAKSLYENLTGQP